MVHRTLTSENERKKNRVNEHAKPDEQLNDRVDSALVWNHKRLKGYISQVLMQIKNTYPCRMSEKRGGFSSYCFNVR